MSQESLVKVDLGKELLTDELPFWKTAVAVEALCLTGEVVNGFKRGSKELGVPTANLKLPEAEKSVIDNLLPGVYCGTVQFVTYGQNEEELNQKFGPDFANKKFRTAVSIGWNPSYDNSARTIESYILEEFENDFYGETLKLEVTHYIRAESNYSSLDHLIMAIHNDIETTKHKIELPQ